MTFQVRRVVTGHDENGKAVVKMDSVPASIGPMRAGVTGCVVWTTDSVPVDLTDDGKTELADAGLRKVGTAHEDGTVFRIVQYEPGAAPRNHRTASIDYGVVLEGEIDMVLEAETVRLKRGDVIVQRGTIHDWINPGKVPCVIAFVLIAAELPSFGGKHLSPTG
jgi:mannose-6-phosphate isomerase-like protein (cupin superfamily)